MKDIGKKAVWVISFLGAFVLFKYGKEWYVQKNTDEKALAAVEKLRTDAIASRPEVAPTQAFSEASKMAANKSLATASSSDKRRSIAADQFVGFYYINVKTRHEYCAKLGVDISPFVAAFKADHAAEFRIMSTVYASDNVNAESFFSKLEPMARKTIDQAMLDMAEQNKITPKDVCAAFAADGAGLAAELSLQKANPATYAALHGR